MHCAPKNAVISRKSAVISRSFVFPKWPFCIQKPQFCGLKRQLLKWNPLQGKTVVGWGLPQTFLWGVQAVWGIFLGRAPTVLSESDSSKTLLCLLTSIWRMPHSETLVHCLLARGSSLPQRMSNKHQRRLSLHNLPRSITVDCPCTICMPGVSFGCPQDPAVLKTLRDSELLRRSVFTTTLRYFLRRRPFFERKMSAISRKMVSADCAPDSKSLCDGNFSIKFTTA